MREGGYDLNEQVSDYPAHHTVDVDDESSIIIPNSPPDWPAPGSPIVSLRDPREREVKVDYVMPHTHVPWIYDSPNTLADHIVGSHGISWASVDVAYAAGRLVELHQHPDGVRMCRG